MTSIGSERVPRWRWPSSWWRSAWWHSSGRTDSGRALGRLLAPFGSGSELSLVHRLAGAAFIIRIVAAMLAFATQIMLARWLGGHQFGIYVYAWTWLLLIGGIGDLGLGSAAQRFVPEYAERKEFALLRGFTGGSRWLAFAVATAIAGTAVGILALSPLRHSASFLPLALASAALPAFAVANVQSGIARSYNWINLGLAPTYILRQVALIALMALLYGVGVPLDAATTMLATTITLWGCSLGQLVLLNRRLGTVIAPGARAYAPRTWLATAMPISLVEGFYVLVTYCDVIVLTQFRRPDEVAVYYAAAKIMALVAFIHFAVSQTVAHKFTEFHVNGDRAGLAAFLAHAIRMTFWPSLALIAAFLALGQPLLWMFGRDFVGGYPLMFVIAIGLLARAAVGPAEKLLNMLGERRTCAHVYAGAFLLNLLLCLLLIPRFGAMGAATASALALVSESACLFWVAKFRLGFHCIVFGSVSS